MRHPTYYEIPDMARVAVVGDWHGNTPWINELLPYLARRGYTHVLHVGDFGVSGPGYHETAFAKTLQTLTERHKITVLFIRGNHDNPDYLDSLPVTLRPTDYMEFDTLTYLHEGNERIGYMSDGFLLTHLGRKIMGLGGAVSIDREFRTPGRDWWAGETIPHAFRNVAESWDAELDPIDVMITHDAPATAPLQLFPDFEARFHVESVTVCREHREYLQWIVEQMEPRAVIHGHYHRRTTGHGRLRDGTPFRCEGLGHDSRRRFVPDFVDEHVLDLTEMLSKM